MSTDVTVQEVRGWLQNASLKYKNAALVGKEVFLPMPIRVSTAKMWKWNVGDTFRLDSSGILAKGAEAHEIEKKGSAVNIDTVQYGWKEPVYDEDVEALGFTAGAVPPANLRQEAIENVAMKLDLLAEKRVADKVIATAWAGQSAGGEDADGLWSPQGSSNTAYVDITARITTLAGKGIPQDRLQLLMDDQTYRALIQCDDVRDRIKYTTGIANSLPTPMSLANSFSLTLPVLVAGALYNSAEEKADGTDDTKVRLWEKTANKGMAFLFYKPSRVSLNMAAPGVQPVTQIGNQNRQNVTYRIAEKRAWYYEGREKLGCDTLMTDAAFMWKDTYAT